MNEKENSNMDVDNKSYKTTNGDLEKPKQFRIILIGDGGTGKSSFADRFNDGNYRKDYVATMGIEKHEIHFSTSSGDVIINLIDTAGQEKTGPLRDSYYKDVDGAIIFFDVTSRITYKNVPNWHRDLKRVSPDILTILCANKIDSEERKVKAKQIKYPVESSIDYFEISVKDKINLNQPIEALLKKLLNDNELILKDSLGTSTFTEMTTLSL